MAKKLNCPWAQPEPERPEPAAGLSRAGREVLFRGLIAAAAVVAGLGAGAASAQSSLTVKVSAQDGAALRVKPPSAFVDACARYAWLCDGSVEGRLTDPDEQLRIARRVNLRVNLATTEISDPENYGVAEYWALPRFGRGDCEDFVLEKYRQLLEAGFDSRDLTVAIALDRLGDNHAVLVVHHSTGDLILDNLSGRVTGWEGSGYRFLAMQARDDKRSWVVVAPGRSSGDRVARQ